jgi:kynurenine 3-monooxygenase
VLVGDERLDVDLLVGADGVRSRVRDALEKERGFTHAVDWPDVGYFELRLTGSAAADLDPSHLHMWPSPPVLAVVLPNPDGSFTCSVFGPYEALGTSLEDGTVEPAAVLARHLPELLERSGAEPGVRSRVGSLVTVRCQRWHRDPGTLILGDASHAILPFLGAGMNAALEDARHLGEILDRPPTDRSLVAAFTARRSADLHVLADLAEAHLDDLRRGTGPLTALKRRFEDVRRRVPVGQRRSKYQRIEFGLEPYGEIR